MNIQYIHAKDDNIQFHDSIVVSIPACHAGDRGSIPRRGAFFEKNCIYDYFRKCTNILDVNSAN